MTENKTRRPRRTYTDEFKRKRYFKASNADIKE